MANAYSELHNYRQELIGPNYQLINAAGQFKQGRLDANRAKLQAVMDQIPALDIIKGEDQEYAEKRFNIAADIVDKYASGDLSNSTFTGQLIGKLEEVVDDNVANAITSTALYRQEQKAWKKLKEENPDKYSQVNHAYAHQNADAWLSDGQVGSKYRGGGGVIEYQDLSKKIMDNLPELQKALKATWVETVPGQGYFMSLETKEAVSRADMDKALNFLFDDKDRQQMGINAWGQYDKMSDEDLAEAYDSYFQPRIDNAAEMIKNLELAKGQAESDKEKAQYDALIGQWKDQKAKLEGHTFQSVASTKGRAAAYNHLYTSQFKDDILDVYSYAPRTIERKVDEVDKANKYYELKLAEMAEKKRHNLAMEAKKTTKKADGSGDPDEPFKRGEQRSIDKPKDSSADEWLENQYAIEEKAMNDMVSVMETNGLTEEDLNSEEFKSQIQNLANKSYIKIGDKQISVADNYDILQNYKNEVMSLAPVKQEAFKDLEVMFTDLRASLRYGNRTDNAGNKLGDLDLFKELPMFNFRLVKGKDGKLQYKFIENDGKNHYYAWLVNNDPKNLSSKVKVVGGKGFKDPKTGESYGYDYSEADKATLNLYMGLHMMHDDEISDAQRKLVKEYVNTQLSKLPKSTADKISTEINSPGMRMKNTHSNLRTNKFQRDFYLSDFDKSDVFRLDVGDNDYSYKGPEDIIEKGFAGIGEKMSNVYAEKNEMLAETYEYVASYGTEEYQTLKNRLGIPDPNYKMDIKIGAQFKDGQPTGKVIVAPYMKNTDKETKDEKPYILWQDKAQLIDASELETELGLPFNINKTDNTYNAQMPRRAKSLYIGNNVYDKSQKDFELTQGKGANTPPIFNEAVVEGYKKQAVIDFGDEIGGSISKEIDAFKRGEYKFALVPQNGAYYIKLRKEGDESMKPFQTMLTDTQGKPVTELTPEFRRQVMSDPRLLIEGAFQEFLPEYAQRLYYQ